VPGEECGPKLRVIQQSTTNHVRLEGDTSLRRPCQKQASEPLSPRSLRGGKKNSAQSSGAEEKGVPSSRRETNDSHPPTETAWLSRAKGDGDKKVRHGKGKETREERPAAARRF